MSKRSSRQWFGPWDQNSFTKMVYDVCISLGHDEKLCRELADYTDKQVTIDSDGRGYVKKTFYRGLEEEIAREFNGRNLVEILKKYKISRSALYRLVKRQQDKSK